MTTHFGEGEDRISSQSGFAIAYIWFDGYYNTAASRALVEIFHVDQQIEAAVWPLIPQPGLECSGSKIVQELLANDDPEFAD
jgi:hypothetical protein